MKARIAGTYQKYSFSDGRQNKFRLIGRLAYPIHAVKLNEPTFGMDLKKPNTTPLSSVGLPWEPRYQNNAFGILTSAIIECDIHYGHRWDYIHQNPNQQTFIRKNLQNELLPFSFLTSEATWLKMARFALNYWIPTWSKVSYWNNCLRFCIKQDPN